MTMQTGTVTIDDDGIETKTHMAGALYDALMAIYIEAGQSLPSGDPGIKIQRQMASVAIHLGGAIVTYIKNNAEAVITTNDGGLQRTANNPGPQQWARENTATRAPSGEKKLRVQ